MVYDSVYEANNYLRGTARKQHFWENFSGSKLQDESSITYETDFSTNTGWVSNASNVVVNTSTKKLTFAWTSGTPNQQIYYDLGSVSDTKFVLRYVVNFATLSSAGANLPVFSIKLSGSNSSAEYPPTASQIAMQLSAGSGSADVYFKSYNTSGGGDPQPTAISWNPTIGTDYYVEMIRDSATQGTLNVRTGSHSGTMVTNFPMTASPLDAGCTGLRYIRLQQYPNSFGNITGTMDDIEFYNGVTSASGNPIRWTANNVTGTNIFAMSDSVDGGFQITTGGGNGDHGTITFNDIRQYAPTAFWSESIETNFKLSTRGTGARTETDTGVVRDTAKHIIGISCGSPNVNMSMDGVLKSTVSSSIPNAPMQPIFYLKTQSATSKTAHITYMECYNT